MRIVFDGEVFEWRGPAPFYFVRVPDEQSVQIREVAHLVTYGWGVIPASVTIGSTTITTSLFPKDGAYLVPLKREIRLQEELAVGDVAEVTLRIG